MPTYMYKCQECGHRFEQSQGFHDDPLEVCPDCGGAVRRVIGNVGVTFKGSGFYRTDSRASGSSPKGGAEKPKGKGETTKPASGDSGGKSKGSSGSSGSSSTKP
jgi:putative FmdB family regulatory protein